MPGIKSWLMEEPAAFAAYPTTSSDCVSVTRPNNASQSETSSPHEGESIYAVQLRIDPLINTVGTIHCTWMRFISVYECYPTSVVYVNSENPIEC